MKAYAIPFKYVAPLDLDALDFQSKGVIIDGDREAVIVIEPSEKLIQRWKELKIEFEELSQAETEKYVEEILF